MFDNVPNMRLRKQSLSPFLGWLPLEDATVLEIGCFAGDGTIEFMACDKIKSIDCVDLFLGGYDNTATASACDMVEVMAKWGHQVGSFMGPRPTVTLHAFQDIGNIIDGITFDLCYIDGDHREQAVCNDILQCLDRFRPKVIAGHDYGVGKHPAVKTVVDRVFGADNVKTFPDTSWAVVL